MQIRQVILHTGDMRWNPRMGKHPALANQRIDQLFLDTTYASPKHTFPSQVWPFWLLKPAPLQKVSWPYFRRSTLAALATRLPVSDCSQLWDCSPDS